MLVLASVMAESQVIQEKTYAGYAAITQLELEGYKYFVTDAVNNKCLLYNTDHSLWKTIDVPVPENNFIAEIAYVSQHLFNENDNIEMLVIYAEYISSGEIPYYEYTTSVKGETGGNLMSVDGGGYALIQDVGDEDAKLLVYVYDLSTFSFPISTEVFDIPGSPLLSPENIAMSNDAGNPFPNPAGSYVNIPYVLDERDATGYLIISDISGKEIRQYKVGKDFHNIRILTSGLGNGIFFYRIQSEHNTSKVKKIILN